ncbi:haloacid dehalogenase [Tenuibacillus multivorans]|nr:haloacid dehalogenase [Tenuibacillus multivorans]
MIGGNGSLIYKNGKVIHTEAFSQQDSNDIKELIEKYNATYLIDGKWDYAYTGHHNHPILQNVDPDHLANSVQLDDLNPIIKVLIFSAKQFNQLEEELFKLDVFINKHRHEEVLDISPNGINKWAALRELGVKDNSFVAFGNDANDLPMFNHALHSVMIGHHDELSKLAQETVSLTDDYEQKIIDKIYELTDKFSVTSTS